LCMCVCAVLRLVASLLANTHNARLCAGVCVCVCVFVFECVRVCAAAV